MARVMQPDALIALALVTLVALGVIGLLLLSERRQA